MKVWYCRDAFGNERLLREPCGGADSAEGCGWRHLISVDALANVAWQFNEAVSLLREVRARVSLPEELGEEIDDGLPAMQSALEAQASQVGETE